MNKYVHRKWHKIHRQNTRFSPHAKQTCYCISSIQNQISRISQIIYYYYYYYYYIIITDVGVFSSLMKNYPKVVAVLKVKVKRFEIRVQARHPCTGVGRPRGFL